MSEMKEKYLGESKLSSTPKKKLNLTLADKVVTTSKLADKSVTPDKLSNKITSEVIQPIVDAAKKDLENQIASIQAGGLALSEELGDSSVVGITQKAITIGYNNLIELIANAQASHIEMLPFGAFVEDSSVTILNERYTEEYEGVVTYMTEPNVFAMYVEHYNQYYISWDETDEWKDSTEYNTFTVVDDDEVRTIRTDKLFYYAAETNEFAYQTDSEFSSTSSKPLANYFLYSKYNDLLNKIEDAGELHALYELSYVKEASDTDPLPSIENVSTNTYAFADGYIQKWNNSRRMWMRIGDVKKAYVKYKNKVGRFLNSSIEWNLVFDTSIIVDGTLDATSTNPISNSAVYKALFGTGGLHDLLDNAQDRIGELEILIQRTATPMVHFDGILDAAYTPETRSYGGTEGSILIDETNGKAVLAVDNGDTTKYYLTWNDGNGIRETSYLYNEVGLSNILMWNISGDSLHIYAYNENHLVEVAGSSSSSSNANIKVIKVWDDSYPINMVWEVGELWYNTNDDSLYECISVSSTGTNPSFRVITPKDDVIYIDSSSQKWYVYYYAERYFRELTNIDLSRSLTEYLQMAQEALAEKQDKVKIIRVWGNDPQVTSDWEEGDFWYNPDNDTLHVCVNAYDDTFEDASFEHNCLYFALESRTLYIYNRETGLQAITSSSVPDAGVTEVRLSSSSYAAINDWEIGDLWYKDDESILYICTDNNGIPDFEEYEATSMGLYYILNNDLLYLYNGNDFIPITREPDTELSNVSTNVVQNKAIYTAIYTLESSLSDLSNEVHEATGEVFDPVACNKGVIDFTTGANKKLPEMITVEDVDSIYTITPLDANTDLWEADDVRIRSLKDSEGNVISGTGLLEGDNDDARTKNAQILRILGKKNSGCPGLKLRTLYYANITSGGTAAGADDESTAARVVLQHDFTIDGEVDGEVVGGLVTNYYFFLAYHSLNLRHLILRSENEWGYPAIIVNTCDGIDQLQVTDCVFEKPNANSYESMGDWIKLNSDRNVYPMNEDGTPINSNYINHIYLARNTASGKWFIRGNGRLVKSCRIINNTFNDCWGMPIYIGINDSGDDNDYIMTYMSCPIYIVGNVATGMQEIKRPAGNVQYGLAQVESHTVYVLHNTISNFYAGPNASNYCCPQYDVYANVVRIYGCNNIIHNFVRFSTNRTNFGVCKSKGNGVPTLYTNLRTYCKPIKYFKYNSYSIDKDEAMAVWNNRTYADTTEGNTLREIDNALITAGVEKRLELHPTIGSVGNNCFCRKFEFSNNTFDCPVFGGMSPGSAEASDIFVADSNTFNFETVATNNASGTYYFAVRALKITVTNNSFLSENAENRVLAYKWYTYYGESSPVLIFGGNYFPETSSNYNRPVPVGNVVPSGSLKDFPLPELHGDPDAASLDAEYWMYDPSL